jgi:hypothetical protein
LELPSEAFKAWLEAKPYKTATKNTYWNDLVRIEKHYGDLDEAYDQDKLSAIRTALNYTAADRRDGRANPAKFPIDGDVYRNLSAYRAKLAVYAKFR